MPYGIMGVFSFDAAGLAGLGQVGMHREDSYPAETWREKQYK
jgi:hypothetical protein